jgi:hypothetical protein
MKKFAMINFLLLVTVIAFCKISVAQQKASDKSFATLVKEVKEKQEIQNKMIQMRKPASANTSQNNNSPIPPANTNAAGATTTTQKITPSQEGTGPQGTNNKPLNQQRGLPVRSKRQ